MFRRISSGNIDRAIKRIERELPNIADQAHTNFVKNTPIDTGNARRSTRLRGDTIDARYNYANVLNDGRSSQARNGMTDPTIESIRKHVRQILGGRF
jgi:hypothetical protein